MKKATVLFQTIFVENLLKNLNAILSVTYKKYTFEI